MPDDSVAKQAREFAEKYFDSMFYTIDPIAKENIITAYRQGYESAIRQSREQPHLGYCSCAPTMALGSPGCICVVVNRNDLKKDQSREGVEAAMLKVLDPTVPQGETRLVLHVGATPPPAQGRSSEMEYEYPCTGCGKPHKVNEGCFVPRPTPELGTCHADRDGDCAWKDCPQIRYSVPLRSRRHCPLDVELPEEPAATPPKEEA